MKDILLVAVQVGQPLQSPLEAALREYPNATVISNHDQISLAIPSIAHYFQCVGIRYRWFGEESSFLLWIDWTEANVWFGFTTWSNTIGKFNGCAGHSDSYC